MLTPRRKSDSYHHGDLRETAISIGLKLIQIDGPNALGIRKIAEKINVSPAALYRHFENIEELKVSISMQVSNDLAKLMIEKRNAVTKKANKKSIALARLRAIGEAYIDYARKEPKLFQIAFYCLAHPEIMKEHNYEDQSWKILFESIDELYSVKLLKKSDFDNFSQFSWSAVHGLATLVSQGFIKPNEYQAYKRSVLSGIASSLSN